MAQITLNSTGVASSGALVLQSNGTTTAVTISTSQVATLAKDAVVNGLTVGRGAGAVSTNTAVGDSALAANQAGGNQNTAVGISTLANNTTGSSNSAFGRQALASTTTGGANTAVGVDALVSNTTASNNTAVGYQALYSNTTGTENQGFGVSALSSVTTGSNNIGIGFQAGVYTTALTTGGSNILIGNYSKTSSASGANQIVMGYDATGKGDNTFFHNRTTSYNGGNTTTWNTVSDRRIKKNIIDNNSGLEKILGLHVRNFEYCLPEEVDAELSPTDAVNKAGVQLGVIAQEIQQVLPECVEQNSTGVLSVNTDSLIWYLVNSIKELKAEIDALKGTS